MSGTQSSAHENVTAEQIADLPIPQQEGPSNPTSTPSKSKTKKGRSIMELLKVGTPNNMVATFDRSFKDAEDFSGILDFLRRSRIYKAITVECTPYLDLQREFWSNAKFQDNDKGKRIVGKIQGRRIKISTAIIREVLGFEDNDEMDFNLNRDQVTGCLSRCGYSGPLTERSEAHKACFPAQYKYLAHVVNHCLSGRKAGHDKLNVKIQSAFAALVLNAPYNFSGLIFHYFKENLYSTSKYLIYARFLQLIINSQAPNLPKNEAEVIKLDTMTKVTFTRMKQKTGSNPPEMDRELICHLANPNYQCPPDNQWRNEDSTSNFEGASLEEMIGEEQEVSRGQPAGTERGLIDEDEEATESDDGGLLHRKRKGRDEDVITCTSSGIQKEKRSKSSHDPPSQPQQQQQQTVQQRLQRPVTQSARQQQPSAPAPEPQVSIAQFNRLNELVVESVTRMMKLENQLAVSKEREDDFSARFERLESENLNLKELTEIQGQEISSLTDELNRERSLRLEDSKRIKELESKVGQSSRAKKSITDGKQPIDIEGSDLSGNINKDDSSSEAEKEEAVPSTGDFPEGRTN